MVTMPPSYTVSQWAERFRYLSREYSAQPGRYSLATVPYAREPMDCANDPSVRAVVLMWGSQLTKTTVIENVCGYFIAADPAPQLLVQPTVEMAQAWSKERLNTTCRDTPALRELISDAKSRDSGNTIQLKTYPGGNLAIIGSNAPAGLAGRPRRVVLLDEVDRYPASAGTEGDPVALAIRRTESFWNSVIFLTSTPTLKGFSRIESEFEQTDKRMWFVPCPKCGEYQTLKWSQVRWTEGKLEEAHYVCIHCETVWTDKDRVEAIRKGEWRPTAPFKGKRGYFLNGIYSPFKAKRGFKTRLHQMASDHAEAKAGGREQLKTWTNTFLAETWDDPADRIDAASISSRVEDYTPDTLPDEVLVLTAQIDVQGDRLEVEIDGIGLEDESWAVEARKLFGSPEHDEVWQDLSAALAKTYRRTDGVELKIACSVIDTGFKPGMVRRFIKNSGLPRVWGISGSTTDRPVLVTPKFNKHYRMWNYSVATNIAKDALFARMRIVTPGPRYMHYPRGQGFDEEYFRQLTAEVSRTTYARGFPKRVYEKVRERNEALDLRVYGMAALDILKPNFAAIQRGLQPSKKPPEQPPPTEPIAPLSPKPRPFRPPRMSGGFVGGWRR